MQIVSSAFQEGKNIPSEYTCDGKNVSPPLQWTGAPEETKSFTLVSDDPDAPAGTWVHWLLWNILPRTHELKEAVPPAEELPDGSRQGTTDFRQIGYGGPCPPSGTHRYFFRLAALDVLLTLKPGATRAQLVAAMKGHILAEATLMGKYRRRI